MKFNFAQDKWIGKDKTQHMIRDAAIFFIVSLLLKHPLIAFIITTTFALLWEVKDGLVSWEKFGWWGGDGFSYKDILAGWVGMFLMFIVILVSKLV